MPIIVDAGGIFSRASARPAGVVRVYQSSAPSKANKTQPVIFRQAHCFQLSVSLSASVSSSGAAWSVTFGKPCGLTLHCLSPCLVSESLWPTSAPDIIAGVFFSSRCFLHRSRRSAPPRIQAQQRCSTCSDAHRFQHLV